VRYGGNDWLIGGASNDNTLLRCFAPVGTDNGATFRAIVETGSYDLGQPLNEKYIREVRVIGKGKFIFNTRRDFETALYGTFLVDMDALTDLWSTGDLWGSGTWGPSSIIQTEVVPTDLYGKFLSLRFSDSETVAGARLIEVGSKEERLIAGKWALYGFIMEGVVLGERL